MRTDVKKMTSTISYSVICLFFPLEPTKDTPISILEKGVPVENSKDPSFSGYCFDEV